MYFSKGTVLCGIPNVTFAMQECMGKIEYMEKCHPPLIFDNSNTEDFTLGSTEERQGVLFLAKKLTTFFSCRPQMSIF